MVKSLSDYLAESAQVYEFRLKLATKPTDEQLDRMELHLRKYDAFDVSTPKSTIIQKNPRDFRSIDAGEIFMIDFKTHLPASPPMLLAELSQKMGINERLMVLRNKLEPLHEIDEEEGIDRTEDGKLPARLTDADYKEAEPVDADALAGEKFKDGFIKSVTKDTGKLNTEYKD